MYLSKFKNYLKLEQILEPYGYTYGFILISKL